jgi:hypothetical protein
LNALGAEFLLPEIVCTFSFSIPEAILLLGVIAVKFTQGEP